MERRTSPAPFVYFSNLQWRVPEPGALSGPEREDRRLLLPSEQKRPFFDAHRKCQCGLLAIITCRLSWRHLTSAIIVLTAQLRLGLPLLFLPCHV
jgi:hypothetical protein